jgi:hypothetical protein
MTQSASKRSTMVEQLLTRAPRHEPEVEDAMEAYQEARARSRGTAMLDLRFLNGVVESFSYAYLTRVRFEPGDVITMRFGRDEIQVSGRNLKRLCETITEQRTSFIQEGTEDEELLKPDGAPHIDQISITELEDV